MDNKRVLIVEDEKDIQELLQARLESEEFECLLAKDGEEALQKARKEMPDLILLDIMLPKMDGYKVCRLLKFDEKYKHIPIIMLTAKTQEADRLMGLETGADEYVLKPFEWKDLLIIIRKYLQKK
ncbi:MAG: response regulator [Thermodesulfobacteriota bacterium]|nr:response regulator [Thermodesulfobacteriota bacterium]